MGTWVAGFRAFSLACVLSSGAAASSFDAERFFLDREGAYSILSARGETPKPENAAADVYVDPTEAVLTLPYCPPGSGVCDPGYLFFPLVDTEVEGDTLPDGRTRFTLRVRSGHPQEFQWIEAGDEVHFVNPAYYLDGKLIELTHVLVRP